MALLTNATPHSTSKKFAMHEFIALCDVVIYVPSISNVKVGRDWWGRPRLVLTYGAKKKSISFQFPNRAECEAALTFVKTAMAK